MLISYKWLTMYFDKPIPSPEEVAKLFTFHAFEVEGLEKKGDNATLDVKILPDRAHYCLSHRGVAGELSAITGIPLKKIEPKVFPIAKVRDLKIKIDEPKLCRRYIGRVIEDVVVTDSPDWLSADLAVVGQRPINVVVDNANGAMFDVGQPLHAFDADKVVGGITVRLAKKGEKITTLDDKDITLDAETLVIADDEGPIAIAGVKGGKRAEVTKETKNLILESANFDPVNIRKTSTRLGIKTDASKRYENEITPELAASGMEMLTFFLQYCIKSPFKIGSLVDVYPHPAKQTVIDFDPSLASGLLGVEISEEKVIELLNRLEIKIEKKGRHLSLTIPFVRLDLEMSEDIVEEIGRLYGYENIKPVPMEKMQKSPTINKNVYYQNKFRDVLTNLGFTEVYTYALQESGEVELENPLASDKSFLRKNLSALQNSLDMNALNAPLLGLTDVRIFEIGKVFDKGAEEHTALGIGFWTGTKKKQKEMIEAEFDKIADAFRKEIGDAPEAHNLTANVMEANLDACIEKLPDPKKYDFAKATEVIYKKPSAFPFIVRDVALFVPSATKEGDVQNIIKQSAGDLVVRGPELFDVFEKGDKKSLAFRLVFQSYEKTLTDSEANGFMEKVYGVLEKEGFELRK
ncbi:MAG: phenylalanine--tRNA ligase subunit beta [Candidatus Pacebacteria bacterium]|nr:phenylalanine--tRNA ligase subunit beta [Candidatus Paceibacterota bacterium]MDD5356612.1 phenylalanine--tRNA ligase subunit beta [Candidatus Paceibacterota bacterium]